MFTVYLRHASCLQTVKPEMLSCVQTFNETMQAIVAEKRVGSSAAGVAMKSMCGWVRWRVISISSSRDM